MKIKLSYKETNGIEEMTTGAMKEKEGKLGREAGRAR